MADRYLVHKPTGVVYMRVQPWLSNPEFEEVADAQGNSLTKKQIAALAKQDESSAETNAVSVLLEKSSADEALSAEASKGMP